MQQFSNVKCIVWIPPFRDFAQSEEGRAGFGTSQQGADDRAMVVMVTTMVVMMVMVISMVVLMVTAMVVSRIKKQKTNSFYTPGGWPWGGRRGEPWVIKNFFFERENHFLCNCHCDQGQAGCPTGQARDKLEPQSNIVLKIWAPVRRPQDSCHQLLYLVTNWQELNLTEGKDGNPEVDDSSARNVARSSLHTLW